jgi:serine/threonine-protein kinase
MDAWRVAGFTEFHELGRGAQGRVVLARHDDSGMLVAIKYVFSVRSIEGFRREARLLRTVENPHVARLYDYVEQPGSGAAMIMEAVDGVSLRVVLSEHGALEPVAALLVLKGSLLGLAAAHQVGVVHRDYKPANVVVRGDGQSKLIDFGIATPAGESSRYGTPAYMAPEQWRGAPGTPATDVYAATGVFAECLTGQPPSNGPLPIDRIPEGLRELVLRGMAEDPAARPAGAAEFVAELERAATARYGDDWEDRGLTILAGTAAALSALFPLAAALASPGVSGVVGGATTAGGAAARAGRWGAAGKTAGAVAGVAVVVAGAAAVVKTTGSTHPKPPVTSTAAPVSAAPIAVKLNSLNQTLTDPPIRVQRAQYAQVSGVPDAAVQKKINRALRAPLDGVIKQIQEINGGPGPTSGTPAVIRATARIGVRTDTLLSVSNVVGGEGANAGGSGFTFQRAVTIDLRTGREFGARDIWSPSTLTAQGMKTLKSRMAVRTPARCTSLPVVLGDFLPAQGSVRDTAFFAPGRMELLLDWQTSSFAPCTDEPDMILTAPLDKVRDLLKPEFATRLPAS